MFYPEPWDESAHAPERATHRPCAPLPDARPRARGQMLLRAALVAMAAILGMSLASTAGLLPDEANLGRTAASALVEAVKPGAAAVDYPVYGSTALVTYLEAGMIKQSEAIDVTFWARSAGHAAITDAMEEAATQNPYVFVEGWTLETRGTRAELRPDYVYEAAEAERRRDLTRAAVAVGLRESGAATAVDEATTVALIHDYIAARASYDWAAFEAIEAGEISDVVHRSQQAYGILVDGTAVCTGYAQAFLAMAEAAGLDAVQVTGSDSAGATGGSHAWNKVRVGGRWVLVDVTWDDRDGGSAPLADYLMVADADPLLATRTADATWVVDEHLDDYA